MSPTPGSRAAAAEHTSDTLRPPPPDAGTSVFESGIPPLRASVVSLAARGEAHAQAAASACTRAEANLSSLRRTLQHLAEAITSADEAREDVVSELDQLRRLLAQGDEEQIGLRHRVAMLEQTLDRNEREHARERAYLLDQQDLFIASLWDEHAQERSELTRRLSAAEGSAKSAQEEARGLSEALRDARERAAETGQRARQAESELLHIATSEQSLRDTLANVELELDEALRVATFAARERDQARAELARIKPASSGRITSIREPHADPSPGFTPLAAIPLVSRSESARAAARADTDQVPTERLGSSAHHQRPSSPVPATPDATQGSTIRQKTDLAGRALVGYSLGNGEVEAEHVENLQPPSRGPR